MATEAQVVANRLNAQKSTGPRTAAGKAAVAQNAVRHGHLAHQAVIKGEDPGQFESYRDEMLSELAPAGAVESMLAERVVHLAWRLRRAERIQAEVFDAMIVEEETSPVRKEIRSTRAQAIDGLAETDLTLGTAVSRDFVNYRVLDRLSLYERRIEHSLYKTMGELQKLRLLRELDEGNHRQAALDPPMEAESTPKPPSQTKEEPLRQTKPISRVSGQKTGFEGQSKGNQSQFGRAGSDRGSRGLTERAGRNKLVSVAVACGSVAPARHETSPASVGHI